MYLAEVAAQFLCIIWWLCADCVVCCPEIIVHYGACINAHLIPSCVEHMCHKPVELVAECQMCMLCI